MRRSTFWCVLVAGGVFFAAGTVHAQSDESLAEIVEQWAASGHADATAEAFTHWNDEGEVPARCVTCHAGAGFRDFHGIDGSAVGSIDQSIPVGGVVDCDTCHADGVENITEIVFPSGVTLPALPNAGTCMTCHQGRASGPTVASRAGEDAADTVNPELSFLNPHYAAAAATNFGSEAQGLYQYPGQSYVGRFTHVEAASTCTACHSPHSLEVEFEGCTSCHEGAADPTAIRVTQGDFDGDGNADEGIAAEIMTLQAVLADGIGAYAATVAGVPIVYDPGRYPYYFVDTNGNGVSDDDEVTRDNAYNAWTPRLLAAAYNYQFVSKDPGSYVHNPKYALQALHDSIVDLASVMDWQPPAISRP